MRGNTHYIKFFILEVVLLHRSQRKTAPTRQLLINVDTEYHLMLVFGRILDLLNREGQLLRPQQLPRYNFDRGCKDLFIIQLNLNETTATSKIVYMRQDRRNDCHALLLRNQQLLIGYPVAYCKGCHFSVLFIEETALLSVRLVVHNLHAAHQLEIGVLWVIEILIDLAAIGNRHVVIERQCDILTPLEGMRVELLILFSVAEQRVLIADQHLFDFDGDHVFLELYSDCFDDEHYQQLYLCVKEPAQNIWCWHYQYKTSLIALQLNLAQLIQDQLWFIISMLAKLFHLNFYFSRSRLRRGPLIDPKLKDLTTTHAIKKKIKEYRKQFETTDINQTFTEVFKQKRPVLGKRFKIDTQKLHKTLKKSINKRITPQSLTPIGDRGDDLKFLNESKSYLHDQRLQVEFQQKFKKELFMKKQTNRMLKKEQNNYKNYLPQNAGNKFSRYLQAKNRLKNNRIDNMMNYKRNNDELQLLIESGLMDEPHNLRLIVEKMNHKQPQLIAEQSANHSQSATAASIVESAASIVESADHSAELHEDPLQGELMSNVTGPEQTRDYSKIQQFLSIYKGHDESMKKKSEESVDLLLQVKQYERDLFLSRYDMINYRFKGRVDFTYFKEQELLSYLKTENVTPVQLLLIFEQNKDSLNRFNLPVITPAVMSRIYSKTSTYKFAQTDQNNKINMLNDPIFKKLESTLFRQLDKISDQHFCDAVWAYASNHELQEGLLNVKKSDAIQRAIFAQMKERIGQLAEEDLGLLLRSIVKLNLLTNQAYNQQWQEIVQVLESRVALIHQGYEYESALQFLSLLPTSNKSVSIIAENLGYFKKYEWQQKTSLLVFCRVSAVLLKSQHLIDPFSQNKTLIVLKQIINAKVQQANTILTTLTINQISRVLVLLEQLNKIPFGPAVPKILLNVAKKEIVSSIHTQKHRIYQYTLPTLITTLSKYDYYQNIIKREQRYIDKDLLLQPYHNVNLLKMVTLRQMLPQRVFTYNSKLYFIYHQMAKLIQRQQSKLSMRSLAQSLLGLCLVQYKNEGIIDTIAFKVLEKVEQEQKNRASEALTLGQTINLIKIMSGYSLQKRVTDAVDEICSKIVSNGKQHFNELPLNILISFFSSYANLYTMPTDPPKQQSSQLSNSGDQNARQQLLRQQATAIQRWQMNKSMTIAYLYSYKNYISAFLSKLQVEQLISLYVVHTMVLNNINRILIANPHLVNQYGIINTKCRDQIKQLLNFISQKNEEFKNEYRFIMGLCLQLNKFDLQLDHIPTNYSHFETLQKQFHDKYIHNILKHQEHVGVNLNYTQIYSSFYQQLTKRDSSFQIDKKIWRIQNSTQQIVYFCATFDHLMAKYYQEQTTLGLFGFWRIYLQIYKRKNWKTQLVCTMLQK